MSLFKLCNCVGLVLYHLWSSESNTAHVLGLFRPISDALQSWLCSNIPSGCPGLCLFPRWECCFFKAEQTSVCCLFAQSSNSCLSWGTASTITLAPFGLWVYSPIEPFWWCVQSFLKSSTHTGTCGPNISFMRHWGHNKEHPLFNRAFMHYNFVTINTNFLFFNHLIYCFSENCVGSHVMCTTLQ